MGTGCINFSPGIQSCCFRIEHDMVFFFFTNVARLCRWVIVSTPIYNPPADCVGFILIFQLPDMITEGCWFIIFLIEACLMLIQSIFETAGSYTGVEFTGLCSCVGYFGSINQTFRLADPIQWAPCLPPFAVTPRFFTILIFLFNFCIVAIYYLGKVRQTAVGYFKGISVKNFVKGVIWRKTSFTNSRNFAATLVLQFRDQGGLNQITSRFLFLLLASFVLVGFDSNFILWEYPALFSAIWLYLDIKGYNFAIS